jgi:hypothetical protein
MLTGTAFQCLSWPVILFFFKSQHTKSYTGFQTKTEEKRSHRMISQCLVFLFVVFRKSDYGIVVRGSVHISRVHTEKSNKMHHCIKIYYSIFIWSSLFRATHRPSSGAWNCTSSLCFCIRGRLLDVWLLDADSEIRWVVEMLNCV